MVTVSRVVVLVVVVYIYAVVAAAAAAVVVGNEYRLSTTDYRPSKYHAFSGKQPYQSAHSVAARS